MTVWTPHSWKVWLPPATGQTSQGLFWPPPPPALQRHGRQPPSCYCIKSPLHDFPRKIYVGGKGKEVGWLLPRVYCSSRKFCTFTERKGCDDDICIREREISPPHKQSGRNYWAAIQKNPCDLWGETEIDGEKPASEQSEVCLLAGCYIWPP